MKFSKIIKIYNKSFQKYKWSIKISEHDNKCFIIAADGSKHRRHDSTNVLKSEQTFISTEVFEMQNTMDEFFDEYKH